MSTEIITDCSPVEAPLIYPTKNCTLTCLPDDLSPGVEDYKIVNLTNQTEFIFEIVTKEYDVERNYLADIL